MLSFLEFHDLNIQRFSGNAFYGLTNLRGLRIGNLIKHFESTMFLQIQSSLTYLVLKGALIFDFNELFTFCMMSHLEYLEFNGILHNRILQNNTFQRTPNLQHLKIANSRVASLDSNVFQPVKRTLKTLNLSNNHFTSLNTSALSILLQANPNIKILLKDNKWVCNCHLKPLTQMVAANKTNFDEPVCWKPGMLSGKKLVDIVIADCVQNFLIDLDDM